MPILEFKTAMPASQQELFAWHERPGAFERLMPPWQDIRVLARTGGIENGATATLTVRAGPTRRKMIARHFGYEPPLKFQDEQVIGPFGHWRHTHLCLPGDGTSPNSGCILHDTIDYAPPMGLLGRSVAGGFVRREIERVFRFRHERTKGDLLLHSRHRDEGTIRVAISGASGVIGSALRPLLTTAGHKVNTLVRRQADPAAGEIKWDPEAGLIDAPSLEGVDAVVHLAGENIGNTRWTAERKATYIASRVESTRLVCRTLSRLRRPPRVLISASAIGFYGDRGDETLTESSGKGTGFLPDLCDAWERATSDAVEAGIRVVKLRLGVVISRKGGALRKMLTPFKYGLGGVIGTGRQYLSWISTDDAIGSIYEAIFNEALSGPVNATAPRPVTNRQFVKTLGRVLHRPTVLPYPDAAIKLLYGEMGQEAVLAGARVLPQKLLEAGYQFRHEDIEAAIRDELGR